MRTNSEVLMIEKCQEILSKYNVPQRHSDFQIEKFIIGKEPTFAARIWQCLREIDSRYESLLSVDFEIENQKDDIILKNIEKKINLLKDKALRTEEDEVNLRKINRSIAHMDILLNKLIVKKTNLEAEVKKFIEIFEELIKSVSYVDFNDNSAQEEYFENKFKNEINLNILLGHPINNELVRSTMCLGDGSKVKGQIVDALNNLQRKLLNNGSKDKQL